MFVKRISCPSCGATLQLDSTKTICEYCGSNIIFEDRNITELEEEYQNLCIRFKFGKTESDYKNLFVLFSAMENYKDSATLAKKSIARAREIHKHNNILKTIKILSPILLIIIIASIGFASKIVEKNNHDVNKINIRLLSITSKITEDTNYAQKDKYIINFKYEMDNKTNVDIDYIEFVMYVDSVDGFRIGSVRSQFGGSTNKSINLKAQDTLIIETYIYTYSLTDDHLINYLYNKTIEDYIYSYEVTTVYFRDGKKYYLY